MSDPAFRERMRSGQLLAGLMNNLDSPDTLEALATTALDFTIIDGEHGSFGIRSIREMVRAARSSGIAGMVRVPNDNEKAIMQVCDAGADGVMIPQVETAAQARALSQSVRYPPHGRRSLHGFTAASHWGTRDPMQHIAHEDSGICAIVQIETLAGVETANEILAIEGLDAVIVGSNDLAMSIGHPGDPNHEDVWHATAAVFEIGRSYGLACGGVGQSPERAHRMLSIGATLILSSLPACLVAGVNGFVTGIK